MKALVLLLALGLGSLPASACRMALMFGIDVSGSINPDEWDLQTRGLSEALLEPEIAALIVVMQTRLSAYQWSGEGQAEFTVPWVTIRDQADLLAFAATVRALPRRWDTGRTAIGAALRGMTRAFDPVLACDRKVIDLSGDGVLNIGPEPETAHPGLRERGIVVNGLAIEPRDPNEVKGYKSLDVYYRERVIHGAGAFVQPSEGYGDYPRAIRLKLRRELSRPIS